MKLRKIKTFALITATFLSIGGLTSCGFLELLDNTKTSDTENTSDDTKTSDDSSDKQNEIYFVKVHIDFSPNIFFDIYDMNFYLDGDFIETIPHGQNKDYTFELKYGNHTFKVTNAPENSFQTECKIEVKDNISTTLYLKGHDGYMDFNQKNVNTIDVHKITYNLNDGINNDKNPTKFESSATTQLYPATKENYSFKGWSYNGSIITSIPQGINNDITLEAVFEATQFNITYNADGATHSNPSKYTIESEIVLTDAIKKGATFINWTDSTGKVVTKIDKGTTGDITLNANFQNENYIITYNLNDGTYSGNLKTSYTVDDSFDLPVLTKEHYTFVTWKDASGKSISKIDKGTTGNLILTAEFIEKEYTITYNLGDGVNDSANPSKFTISSTSFDLKDAKRYKSTFAGWYLNSNFSGKKITNITDLNSDLDNMSNVTLYAKFESDYNFDLAYSVTNGSDTFYLMLDTSKKIVKQFDTSSNTVNTGMYTGDLNSSEYLYSLLINFNFSSDSGNGYLFRTTSSSNSDCVFVLSGNVLTLKQCSVSNAIKAISSMTIIETNESYATLPTTTLESAFIYQLTKNDEIYYYLLYIDIKNNSWRFLCSNSSFTNIVPLGNGTLTDYIENDSYISFYTMEELGTVKISKNNLVQLYANNVLFKRGQ